ncbi:MAG: AEC family transporter [Oscillibacter sp.]|nr:AEC family transporter [Oscillibacter sp.]
MSFLDTLGEMLVLFFAMACGYIAQKVGYLDVPANRHISRLLLNVLLPCMILSSVILGDLPEASAIFSFLGISVIFFLVETAFLLVVPSLLPGSRTEKGVWRYALFFSNTAFVGYPVVLALLGQEGLFYAVILTIPYNLMCYTLGPLLLVGAKQFDWHKVISPGVCASTLALILALTRVRLPQALGETLAFVGDITVPLSLVLLGSLLAELPVGKLFNSPQLWILTFVRLLVMPVALWLVLRPLGAAPVMLGVAVMEMGMPTAVNGSMISIEHGGDTESMSRIIFVTTLASLVTIPIIASLLL